MALVVELGDEERDGLTKYAATAGISVEDAAREAVRYFLSRRVFDAAVTRVLDQHRAALDRLAD